MITPEQMREVAQSARKLCQAEGLLLIAIEGKEIFLRFDGQMAIAKIAPGLLSAPMALKLIGQFSMQEKSEIVKIIIKDLADGRAEQPDIFKVL